MLRQTVILLFGYILLVNGLPAGAPDSVCDFGGAPGHEAVEQDKGTNPYQVVASSSSYSAGSLIQLTISGEQFFRGFFFQPFDKQTNTLIEQGEWIPSSDSQTVARCNGITHTDKTNKFSTTLTFKYTGSETGDLYFKGSIVKTYSEFWTNVASTVA